MAKLSYYYRFILIWSLILPCFCFILLSISDRSSIYHLWKSYDINVNNSTTTRKYTIDFESTTKKGTEASMHSSIGTESKIPIDETLTRSVSPDSEFTTIDQTDEDEHDTGCTPRRNIAFLKTHKCGSSTMQNILLRYGDKNNLTFALPKIGNYAYDHMFTMHRPLRREFVEELPVSRYNILCHHCIFNESAFRNIVYDGALVITVIRSPTRVFESTFSYFGLAKNLNLLNYSNPLLEFMNRAEKGGKLFGRKYVTKRNPMLNAFGLLANKDNEAVIDSLIQNLTSSIDFAIITDHFDESLILLKERLCWDFDDIVYFPQLVRREDNKHLITNDLADRINSWNFGDTKLFEYFNQSLWKQIDKFGRDRMRTELKKFRERKQFWKDQCTEGENVSRFFIALKPKKELKAYTMCWQMTRSEIFYTRYIRQKQLLSFNITK